MASFWHKRKLWCGDSAFSLSLLTSLRLHLWKRLKPNPFSHFQTPCLYSWVRSLVTSLVDTPALTESVDLAAYSRSLVFLILFLLPAFSGCFDDLRAIRSSSFLFLLLFILLLFFGRLLVLLWRISRTSSCFLLFLFFDLFIIVRNLSLQLAHLLLDLSIHSSKSVSPYPMPHAGFWCFLCRFFLLSSFLLFPFSSSSSYLATSLAYQHLPEVCVCVCAPHPIIGRLRSARTNLKNL